MYCSKCGSELPENSRFCPSCGAAAGDASAQGGRAAPEGAAGETHGATGNRPQRPFPLSDWFSFRGRMARQEWWIRTLILLFFWVPLSLLLLMVLAAADKFLQDAAGIMFLCWLAVCFIAGTVSFAAVAARCLHDYNVSGWWLLVFLIPLFSKYGGENIVLWTWLGALVALFLALGLRKGNAGDNRFGPQPQS